MMPDYPTLHAYVEAEILPRYDAFDKAHQRPHAERVIRDALALAAYYPVDREMIYAAAAFHDTGLCEDRKSHHLVSGRIIREDPQLPRWFTPEQIETVAQAAEDHRASLGYAPRSIYGRIIAEADRQIEPETIVRRTVLFGLAHYPELAREEHWQRTLQHLHEKYAEGGYLKLWIPESPNAGKLAQLRRLIADEPRLHLLFEEIYTQETHMKKTIATPEAPKAVGPYSQAVELNGTLFLSGQLPIDPATGLMPEGIEAQTRQSLKNLGAILAADGLDFSDIAKTTVLIKDIADFGAMNAVYAGFFPTDKPARVCYQVAALPMGALVEIDAIAGK